MFHKFKITTCAFILCLFALTLMTVSPVFAADSAAFKQCQQIKPQGKFGPMKQKKNCFRNLARALNPAVEELQAALDKAEADKVELQAFVDKAQASGGIIQSEVDYEKKYNDVKDFINWSAWRRCNAGDGPCKPPFS
jgi:Skp family chaperone for outer membrane proteins